MDTVDRSHSTAPSRKPTLSIRARLVILALLAVVPLMLDRVRLLEQTRLERIEDAATEALDLARRGADGQREIITTTKAMLQVMARAYVGMIATGTTCNFYLSDLAAGMPWVNGMSIVGADGRIKCSTIPNAIGVDMSDRPHIRRRWRPASSWSATTSSDACTRRPIFAAVYPTQAIDASVEGVVTTSVDLQWVEHADHVARTPDRLERVADRQPGHGRRRRSEPEPHGPASASTIRRSTSASANATRAPSAPKVSTACAASSASRACHRAMHACWSVSNEAEVLQRTDREILLSYLQLFFFGLLVLLLAWFGGERLIVDPIRSLARTAERIGRGDLQARASSKAWAKEFAPLTAALNDMARKLADREQELRAANSHLEELASSDALSGLANRRGFDSRLAADWQRAGKLHRPVALLMIDVDHFKLFNDRYGHVEGDVCLRRIGKLLKEIATGDDDLPARYGGEEFALLLPGANIDAALKVGERLRRAVENLCLVHASSPEGQVTISIGCASLVPGVAENAEHLVEAADIALYEAKRRGRNTVVAHGAVVLAEAS